MDLQRRQEAVSRQTSESIATLTGTGLIMAHTHQELRIDPNGKDTTNTINRAELVGVLLCLEDIMREELATGSTFKLLTDSQVTLQSIQKAIKRPATTWLSTHEPVLMEIVKRIKELTEGGHHVHIGKVKAHVSVEGNIRADLAAKKVVTRKIIDSGVVGTMCLSETWMRLELTAYALSAAMLTRAMNGQCTQRQAALHSMKIICPR